MSSRVSSRSSGDSSFEDELIEECEVGNSISLCCCRSKVRDPHAPCVCGWNQQNEIEAQPSRKRKLQSDGVDVEVDAELPTVKRQRKPGRIADSEGDSRGDDDFTRAEWLPR